MLRDDTLSVRAPRALAAAIALLTAGAAAPALAQTTVTLNVPKAQVVYATLRGGSYANANISNILETRASTNATYIRRTLLKFDTQNGVPAGANVTSAIMTITVKDASADASRDISAYQTTMSWDETQTTWNLRRKGQSWNTPGGDLGTKLDTEKVSNVPGTKVSFDITPLVQQAVAGKLGSSRYTRVALLDLGSSTKESYRAYATPDDPDVTARPVLKVTYGGSVPAPTPTPTPTPDPTPAPAPAPSGGSTLKVLEYNVHHGGIGTDGKYNPGRIVDWIVKIDPDIVSLCEMESHDSYDSGDGPTQYQAMLEQKTGVKWYVWDMQDYGDWTSAGIRNAILSKIPFSSTYRHEFSIGKDRTIGGVTITVNGRTINFMSTHYDPDSRSYRTTQAKETVPYATGFAEDRIMLGDFNDQPSQAPITTLTAKYYDAWAEAVKKGMQKSAPDNPNGYTRNSRIDYVFYSRESSHLTLTKVEVVDTRDSNGVMPSDHRPLVATFTVK
jgi:endonuclease/exonuclease/phosphatase family metal-dependent hydrolase